MPKWPETRQVVGKAKYSYDRNLPGMLHAKILRSPYARARIVSMDTDPAKNAPGVKAIHASKGPGSELFYAGDEIVAVAAETEEQARDALRTVKVEYQIWVLRGFVKQTNGPTTDYEAIRADLLKIREFFS